MIVEQNSNCLTLWVHLSVLLISATLSNLGQVRSGNEVGGGGGGGVRRRVWPQFS